MGRQRNNPQMKGKEEASERMLNEIEASQLSHTEFKSIVTRKLNELTENYQKRQGNYNELTANYINMKKEIETIKKSQQKPQPKISKMGRSKRMYTKSHRYSTTEVYTKNSRRITKNYRETTMNSLQPVST